MSLKYSDSNEWSKATLIKRAGKVSGKYTNSWNVTDSLSGDMKYVDLDRIEWKPCDETSDSPSKSILTQEEFLINDMVKNVSLKRSARPNKRNLILGRKMGYTKKSEMLHKKP